MVCDYQACLKFYQEILGFELFYQDANGEEADLKLDGTTLNLIKRESMAKIIGLQSKPSPEDLQDNVALIFTTHNLEETCDRLEAKGVKFITEPMYRPQWQIKTTYLRDPDGNLIGIYEMTS